MDASLNSYGKSEDAINWSNWVRGYNSKYADPYDPYDQNSILFDAVFNTKRQRINVYRTLALYPFCRKCLTIMADESVCMNADGEVATINIDKANKSKFNQTELMSLKEEFDYIINCVIGKKLLWYYYYKWLVDGELFLEICLNSEGNCVAGVKCLPPYCTMCIYDDGILNGFVEDTRLLDIEGQGEQKTFTTNQIAYVNYGFWGNNRNDVRGHLDPVIRPLNQLRAIEDALTVYRITRAPEKRIFKIYTGKLPPQRVQEYMQEVRAKYRKQLSIDPSTGLINGGNNVQAFVEDYWLSQDGDGQGSSVETFKGSTEFNGQLDDVAMFKEQVADGMMIPSHRWKTGDGSGGASYVQGVEGLTLEESSFQKMNARLRLQFADLLSQIFMVQLQVRGFNEKFLDKTLYNIDLIPSNDFARMRALAMAEKRAGVVGSLSQFLPTLGNVKPGSDDARPMFSKQFFMEDILGLSQEQMARNDRLIQLETEELLNAANAAKEEGGESEEEGDEDLGF